MKNDFFIYHLNDISGNSHFSPQKNEHTSIYNLLFFYKKRNLKSQNFLFNLQFDKTNNHGRYHRKSMGGQKIIEG